MTVGSKILRASILRTCDLVLLLGATFFVTPLLVHTLGDRIYGIWMLVGAVVGYYGFLDLGLSAAATKYMSEAVGKDDVAQFNEVASTAHFLFILMAAVVIAATLLTALACPLFLRDRGEVAMVRELIVLMGSAAAIVFPAKVYIGMLAARVRYDYLAAISISRTIIYNGAIYACLRAHLGVVAIAVVFLVVSLLQRAAIVATCRASYPQLKIVLFKGDRRTIREMFDYGLNVLVCQIGDILRFQLDPMVIAIFLNAALVTPYAIGGKLVDGFDKLATIFSGTMLPVFSQYHGRGDYDSIRSTLLKAARFSATVSAFLGLSIIFYGRSFILRWMGPGFDNAYRIAAILSAAQIFGIPQGPGIQVLYGLSKHRVYAVMSICEGVINLALSVALIKPYGIYGVALGTFIEIIVFKLVILPVYICRVAGLSLRRYLFDAILLTQLKAAVPLGLCFYAVSRFPVPSYGVLAACIAVQTALFVQVAYAFVLGEPERRAVLNAIHGLIDRRRPALAAPPANG